jgi:hypothetical protein
LIWTGGQVARRVVKVTWVNLVSLAFILHFLNSFELHVGPFVGSARQRLFLVCGDDCSVVGEGGRKRTR